MTSVLVAKPCSGGWRMGLDTMLSIELHGWRAQRRWLRVLLGWVIGLGGLVALLSTVLPAVVQVAPDASNEVMDGLAMGIQGFFGIGGTALAVGAVLIGQALVMSDQRTGIAEWLLSKPVSRFAYLLAKLAVNGMCMMLFMVVAPSVAAYGVLSLVQGELMDVGPWALGTLALAVHTSCFFALAAMLGVMLEHKGIALGILMPAVLLSQLWGMLLGRWIVLTPWGLSAALVGVVTGAEMPVGLFTHSLVATLVWCMVASCVAFGAFRQKEIA